MTYLIDTDVMVDFFKHKDPAKTLIARLSKHALLALSTLTITELRSGWTKEQANWLLPRLYALCSVVPVTKEIAEQAGIWRQEYKSRGQQLGTPDTVIAATAYLSDFPLVTNNAKDYPMPELKLYSATRSRKDDCLI
jgi:tRNA(fMet)-specific endonuclease VapC